MTPHVPHAFRQRDQNTSVPSRLARLPRGSHVVCPAKLAASIAQLTVCAEPPCAMTIDHDGSSRHCPGAKGSGTGIGSRARRAGRLRHGPLVPDGEPISAASTKERGSGPEAQEAAGEMPR